MLMASENNDIAFRKAEDKQNFLVPFPLLTFFRNSKMQKFHVVKTSRFTKICI